MNVLFVCTGNTCRSPMAEYILKAILKKNNISVDVSSCGVNAIEGVRINTFALTVLHENGIDASDFYSKKYSKKLGEQADFIICMTPLIAASLKNDKARDLTELYGIYPVSDPYGCGIDEYRRVYDVLYGACRLLAEDIKNGIKNNI